MENLLKRSIIKLMILITALSMAASGSPMAVNAADEFPINTPLWYGPYDIYIRPDLNFAYPDTGCVYWSAKITIPEGATLELSGKYAHARYISISSYDMGIGVPIDALHDVQINPDDNSYNPFYPGAKRDSEKDRDFTITVKVLEAEDDVPDDRPTNTLYAKAGDEGKVLLIWRIYVSDENRGITGGVGLPEPHVRLANGNVLITKASYQVLSIDHTPIDVMSYQDLYIGWREGSLLQQYLQQYLPYVPDPLPYLLMAIPAIFWETLPETKPLDFPTTSLSTFLATLPETLPETFPSLNPPVFKKIFNTSEWATCTFAGQFLGLCNPAPTYAVGQYANIDNQYMAVTVNRGYGKLVVIRGKAPVTPETYRRDPDMYPRDPDMYPNDPDMQMRYWSITSNQSMATTKVADGVYDEQVPLDPNGYYTIVMSRPEDRPWNAQKRNGVRWLAWPENGDGVPYPYNHPDDATLIFRNMLPSPDFINAIQNVGPGDDEAEVLDSYMPVCQYMDSKDFEALGDNPWEKWLE